MVCRWVRMKRHQRVCWDHVLAPGNDKADAEVGQDTRFEGTGDVPFITSDQRTGGQASGQVMDSVQIVKAGGQDLKSDRATAA